MQLIHMLYIYIYIYIYAYVKFQDKIFKSTLYSYFQILYGLTMKQKCKNHIKPDQLKQIKITKNRFIRIIKYKNAI